MSTDRWVLLVGGKLDLVRKAKALGLRVLRVQDRTQIDHARLDLADHLITADFTRMDELIALLRAVRSAVPFATAVALSEDFLVPAAEIRKALDLPGIPYETVALLKDKTSMRRRLSEAGVSPVRSELGATAADLRGFLRRCPGAMIAKPTNGAGSVGVFRIEDEPAADAAFSQLAERNLVPFLMEEYLDGIEVSVEAFSFGGRHVVLMITDKFLGPNFVEIGHTMPARLTPDQESEIAALTKAFLDAVGLQDGPSHTELKLTSRGPRVIESHNRVGGDHLNELFEAISGIDMKQVAIGASLDLVKPFCNAPPIQGAAAIRFFTPAPGIVTAISGFDELAQQRDVVMSELNIKPGDQIPPLRSSQDRCGFVVVRGRDPAQASSRADELARSVRIEVEQRDIKEQNRCS